VSLTVVHAPHAWSDAGETLFLAGSIEMGAASAWQDRVIAALGDRALTILNPRRPDWDSSWRQSIDDVRFKEQVDWELDGLERATRIAMYFDPATRAPVTLCELGLVARSGRLVVACPDGFWRKGNVEVVCARYGVPLLPSLEALIAAIHA
jgi:hypothetical protein